MNNWITVRTFTYPHEAHVAKAKLELEGLDVRITDELTAHVHNFISNAIGGVKLQVQEKDFTKAYELLEESGYIDEVSFENNKIAFALDTKTVKLPFSNKTVPLLKLIVFSILAIAIASGLAMMIVESVKPKVTYSLSDFVWCVEEYGYQDEYFWPNTVSGNVYLEFGNCSETIRFKDDGKVSFPGMNSRRIDANWYTKDNKLYIHNSDTLEYVLDGVYKIEKEREWVSFSSDSTWILIRDGSDIFSY